MAGPLSPPARAKSLANDFGPTRGPNSPDQFYVILLDGHPEFGGVELDSGSCPGYARGLVDNDDFTVDVAGMVVPVDFDDATGPWSKVANWAALLSADDDTEMWDYAPVGPIRITAAGPFNGPALFTAFYSDDATAPA